MYKECCKNGIRPIVVFSDEWLYRSDLVLRRVTDAFNCSDTKTIDITDCDIMEVDCNDRKEFLGEHNLEGIGKSNVSVGAYHDGELVAIMCFSHSNNDKTFWKISRYCEHIEYSAYGYELALLNYFKSNYDWNSISILTDNRWGEYYGKVFGGGMIGDEAPASSYYIYENERVRTTSSKFSKIKKGFYDKFQKGLTDYENMLVCSVDRIWDCGGLLFNV